MPPPGWKVTACCGMRFREGGPVAMSEVHRDAYSRWVHYRRRLCQVGPPLPLLPDGTQPVCYTCADTGLIRRRRGGQLTYPCPSLCDAAMLRLEGATE